ncbi:MAG: glycosyltransferase, partial [Nitrospinae bacterium]|nr:glycosyltransferase [Nitrospinota bacterium]
MNIVFFIGQLATGGAERQMVNLACGLSDIGHNVVVATIYPGGNNVKLLKENQRLSYISLWNYPSKRFIERCFQLFFSPLILRKRINHYNPDVVYSMLHMANLIAWLSTRGKLANKLVWGIRSSNMTLNLKRAFPERVCAHVSKTVPLAISNSKSGLKYHKSRRFNPIRFETIPNGIDTNTFRFNKELRFTTRNEFGVIANQSLIGVVARLDPVKGHITFLKAAAKVSQKITDVKFVCVGSGPDDFTKKLQTLTIEHGLENRVMWLGNREDTVAIYSALDLLISPSYSEAFPNVIG